MCYYITDFIPFGDDLVKIEEKLPQPLRRRLEMTFAPIDNPMILSHRPHGDRFVRFTGDRHCDCGVPIACNIPAYDHDLVWWYYYGITKGEYSLRERAAQDSCRKLKQAKRWLSLFRYLTAAVEHFGLLIHWGHDLGELTSDRSDWLDVKAATPETLMLLDRDVVYEVAQ